MRNLQRQFAGYVYSPRPGVIVRCSTRSGPYHNIAIVIVRPGHRGSRYSHCTSTSITDNLDRSRFDSNPRQLKPPAATPPKIQPVPVIITDLQRISPCLADTVLAASLEKNGGKPTNPSNTNSFTGFRIESQQEPICGIRLACRYTSYSNTTSRTDPTRPGE